MKDQSILESAGPLFIAVAVLAVVVFTTWVMVRGQGAWGEARPQALAAEKEAPLF